jgi:hypothetical protein
MNQEHLKTVIKTFLGRGVQSSYGQYGEDAMIQAGFRSKNNGVYVDVGAYHPVLYSNTYALYKKGWRGIVIDPNPKMKELFASLRPRDTYVSAAIGEEGSATYYSFNDGAYNTLDDALAKN